MRSAIWCVPVVVALCLPRSARACGGGIGLPIALGKGLLSVGGWAGAGSGSGAGLEGTWTPTLFGPNLSLGVAAVDVHGLAPDVYGDLGFWFLASVAVGGGYHGAIAAPDGIGAGPELHVFAGVPLALPVAGGEFPVVEPFVRATWLASGASTEETTVAGVQLRFAWSVDQLAQNMTGRR